MATRYSLKGAESTRSDANALVFFSSPQIAQPDLHGSTCDFCPACLRVGGEYGSSGRVLDIKLLNAKDAVFNLDVCHDFSFSSLRMTFEATVALTDEKSHVSITSQFLPVFST